MATYCGRSLRGIQQVRLELKNLLAEQIVMKPIGKGRKGYYVADVKGKPLNILRGLPLPLMGYSATALPTINGDTIEFSVTVKKVA